MGNKCLLLRYSHSRAMRAASRVLKNERGQLWSINNGLGTYAALFISIHT